MTEISGRKVVLLGHQHGALDELWALKFWPDIGQKVTDLISLATPYNGTSSSAALCATGPICAPATRQIATHSGFITALGRPQLPENVDFTSIASLNDMLITPQPLASHLDGASNVEVQDVCPGRQVSHFDILADAVAYSLVIDAMTHTGPADPARIPASVCSQKLMPNADPVLATIANGFLPIFISQNAAAAVAAEPATRSYAVPTPPLLKVLTDRTRLVRGGRIPVRIRCDSVGRTLCRGSITIRRPNGKVVARGPGKALSGRVRIARPRARGLGRAGPASRLRLRVEYAAGDSLRNSATVRRRITLVP